MKSNLQTLKSLNRAYNLGIVTELYDSRISHTKLNFDHARCNNYNLNRFNSCAISLLFGPGEEQISLLV